MCWVLLFGSVLSLSSTTYRAVVCQTRTLRHGSCSGISDMAFQAGWAIEPISQRPVRRRKKISRTYNRLSWGRADLLGNLHAAMLHAIPKVLYVPVFSIRFWIAVCCYLWPASNPVLFQRLTLRLIVHRDYRSLVNRHKQNISEYRKIDICVAYWSWERFM